MTTLRVGRFDSGLSMARDEDDAIIACEDRARDAGLRLVKAKAVFNSFYMRFRVTGTLEPREVLR